MLLLKQVARCMKTARILSFSGKYFPVFGLNVETFSPNVGKYGLGKTPNTDTFHAVSVFWKED